MYCCMLATGAWLRKNYEVKHRTSILSKGIEPNMYSTVNLNNATTLRPTFKMCIEYIIGSYIVYGGLYREVAAT